MHPTLQSKYFDSSMDVNDVNIYYKLAFDIRTKGTSDYKYENFNMIEVTNSKYDNYVISDNIITINAYENSNSKIHLKLDGDSF